MAFFALHVGKEEFTLYYKVNIRDKRRMVRIDKKTIRTSNSPEKRIKTGLIWECNVLYSDSTRIWTKGREKQATSMLDIVQYFITQMHRFCSGDANEDEETRRRVNKFALRYLPPLLWRFRYVIRVLCALYKTSRAKWHSYE